MARIEIWGPTILKEQMWLDGGFANLAAYIESIDAENKVHPKVWNDVKNMPLASFGIMNKDGTNEVKFEAKDYKDLPATDIEGVLEFNKSDE